MNKQSTYNNAVTSIRPTDNRLHFGHWVGNISSLIKYQDEKCCYFIFADLQMQNMISNEITNDSIRNNMICMMRQMINLGVDPEKVTFAIESVIKKEQLSNVITLSDYLTNTRINRLPLFKKQEHSIEDKQSSYKMSMCFFPILQALDFLITQSSAAFSNNDNKHFIELINELFKKINSSKGYNFPRIDLITGIVDFLPGYDGYNMRKNQKNCIFLDDTYEDIKKKIRKIPTNNRVLDDKTGNIILEYSKAFCQFEDYQHIFQQYENNSIRYEQTKEHLSDLMYQIAQKSQSNSIHFSDNELWNILLQGSNSIKENYELINI